ncbi:hypothetical protein [Thalassotalea sp. PLHSN55]|uniref:hypothetical protein n=1 Tax=Thalassotalea sp. PLHSN55 TaxID=3435888 RepID=UPI003F84B110
MKNKVTLKPLLLIFLVCLSYSTNASEAMLVKAHTAIKNLDAINSTHWSYIHTQHSNYDVVKSEFDPRRPKTQQWKLLLVDRKVPTVEQLTEFDEIWNAEDDIAEVREPVSSMIAKQSLVFSHQQNDIAVFTFIPVVEDMLDQQDKLTGKLRLNLSSGDISEIIISNTEPLTPAGPIELEVFNLALEFVRHGKHMAYHRITMKFSGTAGLAKRLSEQSIEEFSDYFYVGTGANP